MKKKIKLRDMTVEQYERWDFQCVDSPYNKYPFNLVMTCLYDHDCWIYHKDMFSDKFLNHEVEIEVPDILNKEEKEYLSAFIKPFRDKVISISRKIYTIIGSCLNYQITYFINIEVDKEFVIYGFQTQNNMYKHMELDKKYTLEELGL